MNEQALLDDGFDDEKNTDLLDTVRWWEKKRLLYNIIIFGLELLMMGMYWGGTIDYGIIAAIIFTVFMNIGANMFYTIGWGIEILFLYYFKIKSFGNGIRTLLYLMGVMFSLLWLWVIYVTEFS